MSTLKALVDETTNMKNELVTCHTNLKNNLVAKGVECSDSDKLLSLINKINNISLESLGGIRWASGVCTASTSTSKFYSRNSIGSLIATNYYYCTVTNLSFKPSIIVGYEPNCTRAYNPHSIFVRSATNKYNDLMISSNFSVVYDYGITDYFENGFMLPCAYSGMKLQWVAFE